MPRVACAFTINLPHRKNKKQKTERFRYTVIQMTTMSCQRHIGIFSKQHLLPSLDVAISPYCNSLHTTFPGQQWMHWLCVGAQRASNPNRDKISLFLSRLHNGSCGEGEKKRKKETFSTLRSSSYKKPSEFWLPHLQEASPTLLGMTCRFVPRSPRHAAQPHF